MATTADELREEVRRRYAESARAVARRGETTSCGGGSCCAEAASDTATFGEALYGADEGGEPPEAAALASLGCGNPTAIAEPREGEGEYMAGLEAAGFEQVSVELTHRVADGMHGAIVQAAKTREPDRRGLPVFEPAASAGCC